MEKEKESIHSGPSGPPAPPRPDSHLAGVHSSEQEAATEHPGGELALRHLVAHRVVDDLHRGLLQHLRLLTCASATKKKGEGGSGGVRAPSSRDPGVGSSTSKGANGLD